MPVDRIDQDSPRVAVIVCTRDRGPSLRATLQSLSDQTFTDFEVLVVDQSRADDTQAAVTPWLEADARFRYRRLQKAGLSLAYNVGIGGTTAPLLAFTDDDCVAPADWLQRIVEGFDREPDVALLYGQVLVPPDAVAREGVDGYTPAWPIPRRRRLSRRDGFEICGMGADFAARRSLFARVGGFDEVLGGGGPLQSSQDFDLTYRTYLAGETTLLEPAVFVYHLGFRRYGEVPAMVRSYAIGVGGFWLKHARTGDLYAGRQFLQHLAHSTARAARHSFRRSDSWQWPYIGHLLSGARRSFAFRVDRSRRLYGTR
jgi:glycosyltransferase involved in cell wall biosynthesis